MFRDFTSLVGIILIYQVIIVHRLSKQSAFYLILCNDNQEQGSTLSQLALEQFNPLLNHTVISVLS